MKFVAIVQARVGSMRLPNKVMRLINGVPMIEIILRRLKRSKKLNDIIVATSDENNNTNLVNHVKNLGFSYIKGSEEDVLDRYYEAAKHINADVIVRITGDCPLVDPILVDEFITKFKESNVDYYSNTLSPTFPDGLDVELIRFEALKKAHIESTKQSHREHVTTYIKDSDKFLKKNHVHTYDYSKLRWTVDDPEDLQVITDIFDYFKPNIYFGWKQVLELYYNNTQIFSANSQIPRNQGESMNKGQKLWKRAKKIIPGGSMLFSKRPELFLPNQWPTYYKQAKGCKVWDLEGREYIDMSLMGVGTNILGYGHPDVDEAVSNIIMSGNMSTLNCPEDVFLAERLIALHPWSDMVRFARSGGEANSIAIRIARAASGRDKVAVCGYHGWHDWYLSANLLNKKELDGHLLAGLETQGVPRNLQGTVFTFKYNNYEELENLINTEDIGVIKMEVERTEKPNNDFLNKVRKLADKNNIILIFDECTSGFRETFGGIHKKYLVEPDMAIFGKALGNGYAITAIIGRRHIMEYAQSTFISSTFWTERIGPVAALKTLEIMEKKKSWKIITDKGIEYRKRLTKLAKKYDIKISINGIPALTGFNFESKNSIEYKTLISQEMLSRGFLAGNSVYFCTEHTAEIIDNYFENLEKVFKMISDCENGQNIKKLLKGDISRSGFMRLA